MDLQGEFCLEQFLFGISEAQIGEDIVFAFFSMLVHDFSLYIFLYRLQVELFQSRLLAGGLTVAARQPTGTA